MKTNITSVTPKLRAFLGTAQSDKLHSDFFTRVSAVRLLYQAKEGRYSNIETRIAFVVVVSSADDNKERDFLLREMGITLRTYQRWIKDVKAYTDGTLKARTVVIRK